MGERLSNIFPTSSFNSRLRRSRNLFAPSAYGRRPIMPTVSLLKPPRMLPTPSCLEPTLVPSHLTSTSAVTHNMPAEREIDCAS